MCALLNYTKNINIYSHYIVQQYMGFRYYILVIYQPSQSSNYIDPVLASA